MKYKGKKIGIIGFGFVGQAMYANIKLKNKVIIYDKYKNHSKIDDVLKTSSVFVQVPTPSDENGVSTRSIVEILSFLSKNSYKGIVIIKSTIIPESFTVPNNLKVVSNPEFLQEVNAVDDFKNQKNILLGGDFKHCYEVQKIYEKYFDLNCEYTYVSFKEALNFKYFRNIKIAYDVMFANFMQDTSGDYLKYNKLFEKFPLKPTHKYSIKADGSEGISGHCLPKDTLAHNSMYPHKLTDFILKYNDELKGI